MSQRSALEVTRLCVVQDIEHVHAVATIAPLQVISQSARDPSEDNRSARQPGSMP